MKNKQKAITIWITGLSASGKSTLAKSIKKVLSSNRINTVVLDGDHLRKTVNKDLSFSIEDRKENNRRIAEIARIMNDEGINVVCALISPTNEIRNIATEIIGQDNLVLTYVNTSIEICESRDQKYLYKKAKQGNISNFTGISSVYEVPKFPDITLNGENSLLENLNEVTTFLNLKYQFNL